MSIVSKIFLQDFKTYWTRFPNAPCTIKDHCFRYGLFWSIKLLLVILAWKVATWHRWLHREKAKPHPCLHWAVKAKQFFAFKQLTSEAFQPSDRTRTCRRINFLAVLFRLSTYFSSLKSNWLKVGNCTRTTGQAWLLLLFLFFDRSINFWSISTKRSDTDTLKNQLPCGSVPTFYLFFLIEKRLIEGW
jgi:hypothetical protein